jgi:hypothetical protein
MPVLFFTIVKKVAPYLKYVVFAAAIITLGILLVKKTKEATGLTKAMAEYKRQMEGKLTTQEQQFEKANDALGVAQSTLLSQNDLIESYKKDKIADTAAFEAFKKKYNVELQSYQLTIAQLQQQISNGKTIVKDTDPRLPTDSRPDKEFTTPINPATTKLAYEWSSGDGRFELDDPDVFVAGNETFKLHQEFKITGQIYQQKTGFLQTEQLTLQEVVVDGKNKDGTPNYKVVNTGNVVSSEFKYTVQSPDTWVPHKNVFRLTGVVSGNLGFNNGLHAHFLLGTGLEVLAWRGLGLGVQVYYDANAWKESGFGLDLSYRPTIKGNQLNVGFTLGLATQFQAPFQSYIPMAGIQVFLW